MKIIHLIKFQIVDEIDKIALSREYDFINAKC